MATKKKQNKFASLVNTPEFKRLSRRERKAVAGAYMLEQEAVRERQLAAGDRRIVRRKVRREAKQAKAFFKAALKKNSPESNQARAGRTIVRGVASSLRTGSGRGLRAIVKLPRVTSGWSDMGLIAGSPFKEYKSRPVFPSSAPSRTLHPQEKAEIDALIQKVRLFGAPPLQLSTDNKKKTTDEVL